MRDAFIVLLLGTAIGVYSAVPEAIECPSFLFPLQSPIIFGQSSALELANNSTLSAVLERCNRSSLSPARVRSVPSMLSPTTATSSPKEPSDLPQPRSLHFRPTPQTVGKRTAEDSQRPMLEMRGEDLQTLAWEVELLWCVVVIAVALWFGFRLGVSSVPAVPKSPSTDQFDIGVHALTQMSTTVQSPETQQDDEQDISRKSSFFEFSLNTCPTPVLTGVSEDVSDIRSEAEAVSMHIENGRLKSTFRDVTEVWCDYRFKYYTAVHLLEGKMYMIKEVALPASPSEASRHQVFQDIQSKAKCNSKYVIRYITCWLEEVENAPAAQSRVRIFVQIEYFSLTSLADFLIQTDRLLRSDACYIFRQILKGLCHIHEQSLGFYDMSTACIFVDSQLNVKIADFELAPALKHCRSLTLDRLDDESTDSPVPYWQRRNMRSLGLMLYQLLGGSREGLRDLAQENSLAEDFVAENQVESQLILWMVRQNGQPAAEEVMRSREFQRWSETTGVYSALMKAGASPLLPMPVLSLTKSR